MHACMLNQNPNPFAYSTTYMLNKDPIPFESASQPLSLSLILTYRPAPSMTRQSHYTPFVFTDVWYNVLRVTVLVHASYLRVRVRYSAIASYFWRGALMLNGRPGPVWNRNGNSRSIESARAHTAGRPFRHRSKNACSLVTATVLMNHACVKRQV